MTALLLLFGGSAALAVGPRGAGDARCRVPALVGLSLARAEKRLRAVGCRVGAVQRHASSVRGESRVLRQQLPAGYRRAAGVKVGLLVDKGPKHLLPYLGPIIPRRLPPYIAYDWYDPSTSAVESRLVAPDGSEPHQVAQFAGSPSWSPDATQILSIAGCLIGAANPDGSDGRVLFPPGVTPGTGGWACVDNLTQARWSPDGSAIVFTWWPDVPHPIYVANADGTGLHPVPNTEGGQNASFSPDGRWLIFDKPDEQTGLWSHIYAIRPDGRGRRRLTNWSGEGASWSPDGTRIIYACATHPEADSQLAHPSGTPHAVCEISNNHPTPRTLYSNPRQAVADPTWNANGSKIVLTIGGQIALLSSSGGAPVMITHPPGTASAPDW